MDITTIRAFVGEVAAIQSENAETPADYLVTKVAMKLRMEKLANTGVPTMAGKALKAVAKPAAAAVGGVASSAAAAVAKPAAMAAGSGGGAATRVLRTPVGGQGLKPTNFTPPPGGMPQRNTMMPGANVLKPTAFTPPSRESQFAASAQSAPIGPAAQTAHQAGFHHDPFGGGEFKVRTPRPGTAMPTGKFANLRKFAGFGQFAAQNAGHAAEIAGLGILAKPSIDEMRGKEVAPKKKARTELAGLGVLAAPSVYHMGAGMLGRAATHV